MDYKFIKQNFDKIKIKSFHFVSVMILLLQYYNFSYPIGIEYFKILVSMFQVVNFIGRIPLLAPITEAFVSGKQSHGDSSEDTSPVSEILYGYGRK